MKKKIYCIKCNKNRKLGHPKISYTFDKTLALFIIFDKYISKDEKRFRKEESGEILKFLGLFKNVDD